MTKTLDEVLDRYHLAVSNMAYMDGIQNNNMSMFYYRHTQRAERGMDDFYWDKFGEDYWQHTEEGNMLPEARERVNLFAQTILLFKDAIEQNVRSQGDSEKLLTRQVVRDYRERLYDLLLAG